MDRPSIVLLTVDSLRYDAVFTDDGIRSGLSGFRQLVETGVSFPNAWATGPYTRVSVPSILSGSYQWSYSGDVYESERPHLGSILQACGYTTAGFHSNPFLDARYGWDRGFDYYTDQTEETNGGRDTLRRLALRHDKTKAIGRKIMSFIGLRTGTDIRGKEQPYLPAETLHQEADTWIKTQSEPVFCWLHYMDVHSPWSPHEGTVSEGMDERELTQLFYRARETPQTITETERKRLKQAYTGAVQHFDRRLSSFLDTLQTRLDDPIVCLTSDHGELFGKNGSYFHPGDLHPELLRVPLVVSPSADIQPTSDPVSTVDILPTLAAVAGSDDVSGVDGRNLQRHVGDRTVFASVNDSVRVVTNECTAAYHIDQIPEEHLSEWGPEQIQSSDDMDQFDDEDLQERLEALGYR